MLAEPLREVLAAYWRWKRPTELAVPRRKAGLPTLTQIAFSELARRRRGRPASPSRFIRIHCATRLPRICWRRE